MLFKGTITGNKGYICFNKGLLSTSGERGLQQKANINRFKLNVKKQEDIYCCIVFPALRINRFKLPSYYIHPNIIVSFENSSQVSNKY